MSGLLRRIQEVQPLADSRLRITFEGGECSVIDFAPVILRGGVFEPMKDEAFFARAAVDRHGRAVCWPGEIEFCADALWLATHASEVA